jgi:hypothetical protein
MLRVICVNDGVHYGFAERDQRNGPMLLGASTFDDRFNRQVFPCERDYLLGSNRSVDGHFGGVDQWRLVAARKPPYLDPSVWKQREPVLPYTTEDTGIGGSVVTRESEGALFHPSFPKPAGLQELDEMDEGTESGDLGFRVPEDFDPTAKVSSVVSSPGVPGRIRVHPLGESRGGRWLRHSQYFLSPGRCFTRQTGFNCRK